MDPMQSLQEKHLPVPKCTSFHTSGHKGPKNLEQCIRVNAFLPAGTALQ